jgi:hypothetical protein
MISILIPKEGTLAASGTITLLVTLLLLAWLIQKEISGSLEGDRARRLSQALDVALVPLVVAFIVNAVVMIVSTLR